MVNHLSTIQQVSHTHVASNDQGWFMAVLCADLEHCHPYICGVPLLGQIRQI